MKSLFLKIVGFLKALLGLRKNETKNTNIIASSPAYTPKLMMKKKKSRRRRRGHASPFSHTIACVAGPAEFGMSYRSRQRHTSKRTTGNKKLRYQPRQVA